MRKDSLIVALLCVAPSALAHAQPTTPPDAPAPVPVAAEPAPVPAPATAAEPAPAPAAEVEVEAEAETEPADTTGDVAEKTECGKGGTCKIGDLKTPASPAFALIGVTPETVNR